MKVVVLGAGLAGVTTAWKLARDGHQVTVLDRESQVAAAASFANGGIIASSRPFPWPGPHMLPTLAKALAGMDAAIRIRMQLDPHFWGWGLRFLACCTAKRFREILGHKARLVHYSQAKLAALVAETGVQYKRLSNGVLYVYRSNAGLEQASARADSVRKLGISVDTINASAVAKLEPGIERARIAGALYAPGDEAGDSALFCRELAQRCEKAEVAFRMNCEIVSLDCNEDAVTSVVTRAGRIEGDAFVCALGVIEPRLRGHLGTKVWIYPVKGYSATVGVANHASMPRRAGADESKRIAYCPLGDRIRITGGADFVGYSKSHRPEDFDLLVRAFEELFPRAADRASMRTWACQRPMTPESTPRFGTGRYRNLWFNVGQGHMGWAMAAGSAQIVADLISGREPEISLEGLRVES